MLWDDVILCTVDDVLKRLHSLGAITNVDYDDNSGDDSNAEDAVIIQKISDVKEYTRKIIIRDLTPILRRNFPTLAFLDLPFFSSGNSNDIYLPDAISNPEILQMFAIYRVIGELYFLGSTVVSVGLNFDDRKKTRDEWFAKAKEEYDLATPLLEFDLNNDDVITEDEKVSESGPYDFYRK